MPDRPRCATIAAAIVLASGIALAEPQEPLQRRQSQATSVEYAEELHDNSDVETRDYEVGMVAD